MRDNAYLEHKLAVIWRHYFSDIKPANRLIIKFGPKAGKRLGSIREHYYKRRSSETVILINGHFRDHYIPEYIIDATIAHELCHYVHGFASPMPQLSRYPHRGGVVDKEMAKRGLTDLENRETNWLQKNWMKYLRSVKAFI